MAKAIEITAGDAGNKLYPEVVGIAVRRALGGGRMA